MKSERKSEKMIISAFSALGKTYLGNKNPNVVDFEASFYKWIYDDKELEKDVEKRKGVLDRIQNPEYPNNYLEELEKKQKEYSIVLITPERKIRQILQEKNIEYLLAYPKEPSFVVERALKRGNNSYFAKGLEKTFKQWYPMENEKVLWVEKNEYLEDVLIKNGQMIPDNKIKGGEKNEIIINKTWTN
ncbi:MAG: hypothetical protein HFJ33_06320 [Clostridia bacterium]|nr:hypothetical protein [Clostridia bacterium]